MIKKIFKVLPLEEIIPYENNPRINDEAVKDTMESIRQCENLDPIELDENNVILSGHTRLKALKILGYKETEVVEYEGLTEEQKKKYRLLANKTAEKSFWDEEKLEIELEDLDFNGYDFGFGKDEENEKEPYSPKVNIPQYEVSGAKPLLAELCDTGKNDDLITRIQDAPISPEERAFLIHAASRHIKFNYRNIAEYYANVASPEMQRLMEESALVIIDLDDAIANGYAKLVSDIEELAEEDDSNE